MSHYKYLQEKYNASSRIEHRFDPLLDTYQTCGHCFSAINNIVNVNITYHSCYHWTINTRMALEFSQLE